MTSPKTSKETQEQTPFLQTHADFKNVFYDKDFQEVRKAAKKLSDILEAIQIRIDRHETLKIAKSVFDYVTQKEMYLGNPHLFYDFRCADTRICIGRTYKHGKNNYFVSVCGYKPSTVCKTKTSEFGYGQADTLEAILNDFYEVVYDFILTYSKKLF